jgi:DNA repair ATPase RecN
MVQLAPRQLNKCLQPAILLILATSHANTQIRLYDATRDAAAQEAKKTVDNIQTGDLFKRQANNLQLLTEKDFATTLEDARVEMSSWINAFISWGDVEDMIHGIKPACTDAIAPPPNINDATSKLNAQESALNSEIKRIRASATSSTDPTLDRLANDLGQFESALRFAKDQLSIDKPAVNATISVLDQLESLCKAYQDQMEGVDKARSKLQDLKVELKKAMLASLKIDEDYLLAKLALNKRCQDEYKPIQQLIDAYKLPQGVPSDERIDETLQRLSGNTPDVQQAAKSLFVGAALASRGKLPERL